MVFGSSQERALLKHSHVVFQWPSYDRQSSETFPWADGQRGMRSRRRRRGRRKMKLLGGE